MASNLTASHKPLRPGLSTYYDLADEEVRDKGSQNKATLGHSVKKNSAKTCPVNGETCLDQFSVVILPSYKTSAHPRNRDHVTIGNESTKGGGECSVQGESDGSCEAFHSATAIGQCKPDDSESLYSIQSGRPKKSTSTDSEMNLMKPRVARNKRTDCYSSRYRRRSLSAEKNVRRVRYSRDGRITKSGTEEISALKNLKVSGYSDSRTFQTKSPALAKSRRQTVMNGNSTGMKPMDEHGETLSPNRLTEFRPLTDSSTVTAHDIDAEKKVSRRYDPGEKDVPDRGFPTRSPKSSSTNAHRSRETDRVYNKRPTVSSRSSNLSSNTNDSANNTANNTSMAVGELSSMDEHNIHRYCSSRKTVQLARAPVCDPYVVGGRLVAGAGKESERTYSLHIMKNRQCREVHREGHEVMDDTSSNAGGRDNDDLARFREAPLLARNKYLSHDRPHLYEDCAMNPARWSSPLPERLTPSSLMSERARLARRSRRLRFGDSKHYLDHSILYGSQRYRVPKKDKSAAHSGKSRAAKSSKATSESTKSEHPSGSTRKKTDHVSNTHHLKTVRPSQDPTPKKGPRKKAGEHIPPSGTNAAQDPVSSKAMLSPQVSKFVEFCEHAVSGVENNKTLASGRPSESGRTSLVGRPSTSGRSSLAGRASPSGRSSLVGRQSVSLMPSTSGRPLEDMLKDAVEMPFDYQHENTTEKRRSSLNTTFKMVDGEDLITRGTAPETILKDGSILEIKHSAPTSGILRNSIHRVSHHALASVQRPVTETGSQLFSKTSGFLRQSSSDPMDRVQKSAQNSPIFYQTSTMEPIFPRSSISASENADSSKNLSRVQTESEPKTRSSQILGILKNSSTHRVRSAGTSRKTSDNFSTDDKQVASNEEIKETARDRRESLIRVGSNLGETEKLRTISDLRLAGMAEMYVQDVGRDTTRTLGQSQIKHHKSFSKEMSKEDILKDSGKETESRLSNSRQLGQSQIKLHGSFSRDKANEEMLKDSGKEIESRLSVSRPLGQSQIRLHSDLNREIVATDIMQDSESEVKTRYSRTASSHDHAQISPLSSPTKKRSFLMSQENIMLHNTDLQGARSFRDVRHKASDLALIEHRPDSTHIQYCTCDSNREGRPCPFCRSKSKLDITLDTRRSVTECGANLTMPIILEDTRFQTCEIPERHYKSMSSAVQVQRDLAMSALRETSKYTSSLVDIDKERLASRKTSDFEHNNLASFQEQEPRIEDDHNRPSSVGFKNDRLVTKSGDYVKMSSTGLQYDSERLIGGKDEKTSTSSGLLNNYIVPLETAYTASTAGNSRTRSAHQVNQETNLRLSQDSYSTASFEEDKLGARSELNRASVVTDAFQRKLDSPSTLQNKSVYTPLALGKTLQTTSRGDMTSGVQLNEQQKDPYRSSIQISRKTLQAHAGYSRGQLKKRETNSPPTLSPKSDRDITDSTLRCLAKTSRVGSINAGYGIFYHDTSDSSRRNSPPFRYHKNQTSAMQTQFTSIDGTSQHPSNSKIDAYAKEVKPAKRTSPKMFYEIVNRPSSHKVLEVSRSIQVSEKGTPRKTLSMDKIDDKKATDRKASSISRYTKIGRSSSITNIKSNISTQIGSSYLPRRLSSEMRQGIDRSALKSALVCESTRKKKPKSSDLYGSEVRETMVNYGENLGKSQRHKERGKTVRQVGSYKDSQQDGRPSTSYWDSGGSEKISRLESNSRTNKDTGTSYFKDKGKKSITSESEKSPSLYCSAAMHKSLSTETDFSSQTEFSCFRKRKNRKSGKNDLRLVDRGEILCSDCKVYSGRLSEKERTAKNVTKEVTWKDEHKRKITLPTSRSDVSHYQKYSSADRMKSPKTTILRSAKRRDDCRTSRCSKFSANRDMESRSSWKSEDKDIYKRSASPASSLGKNSLKDDGCDSWMTDDEHATSRSYYSSYRPRSTSPCQRDASKRAEKAGSASSYTSMFKVDRCKGDANKEEKKPCSQFQSLPWSRRDGSEETSASSRSGKQSYSRASYGTDLDIGSASSLSDNQRSFTPRSRSYYRSASLSPDNMFESPSRRYRHYLTDDLFDTTKKFDSSYRSSFSGDFAYEVGTHKSKEKEKDKDKDKDKDKEKDKKEDKKGKEHGGDDKTDKSDKKGRKESKVKAKHSTQFKSTEDLLGKPPSDLQVADSSSKATVKQSEKDLSKPGKKSTTKANEPEMSRKPSLRGISDLEVSKPEETPKISESSSKRPSPKPESPPIAARSESKDLWNKPTKSMAQPSPSRSVNGEMSNTSRQKPATAGDSSPARYITGDPCSNISPTRAHGGSLNSTPSRYGITPFKYSTPTRFHAADCPPPIYSRHQCISPSRELIEPDCPPLPRQPSNNNSISQTDKQPRGSIVYQNALRYACFNGVRVIGGVRVLLDAPCKTGYVQIISPLNEVFITHYISSMTYLSSTSAAGVAWSGIAFKQPTKNENEVNKSNKKGKSAGMPEDCPEGVAKVDVVQIVFCDPYQAHRFHIVVETLQCAFAETECATLVTCHKYGCPPGQTYPSAVCEPMSSEMYQQPGCSSPGFLSMPSAGFVNCCPVQNSSICKQPTVPSGCGAPQSVSPGDFVSANSGCSPCPGSWGESQYDASSPQGMTGVSLPDGTHTGYPCHKPQEEIYDPYAYEHCMEKVLFNSVACLVKLAKDKTWLEMQQGNVIIKQCANGMGFSLTFECTAKCGAISHYIRRDTIFERAPRTQHGFIYNTITSGDKGTFVEEYLISFQNKCQADNFKLVVDRCHKLLMMTASRSSEPSCSCQMVRGPNWTHCGNNNCAQPEGDWATDDNSSCYTDIHKSPSKPVKYRRSFDYNTNRNNCRFYEDGINERAWTTQSSKISTSFKEKCEVCSSSQHRHRRRQCRLNTSYIWRLFKFKKKTLPCRKSRLDLESIEKKKDQSQNLRPCKNETEMKLMNISKQSVFICFVNMSKPIAFLFLLCIAIVNSYPTKNHLATFLKTVHKKVN